MGSCFKDALSREWDITISVGTFPRIRSAVGIDLNEIATSKVGMDTTLFKEFITDAVQILYVVYAICKAQVDAQKLTFDDFATGFEGDGSIEAVENMRNALVKELHDFFLRSKQPIRAAILKRIVSVSDKTLATELARAEAVLDQIEAKVIESFKPELTDHQKAMLNAEMDEQLNRFAGNGQAQFPSTLPT